MIFKTKKIPRHLIIQDEYEPIRRPRFGFFKLIMWSIAIISLTYIVSVGMVQI
ncbi:MAG: hypothetical protein P8M72_00090 [Gammaproteobacteria bacterium]|nr:hypothetical protein [Gammaproteobacteria bacterium]